MTTPIFTGGQVVGAVEGDEFRKTVQKSKHMLRLPPAWCLSVESLQQAEAAGAKRVVLFDTETGDTLTASLEFINLHGQPLERGGCEPQIRLDLRYWTRTPKPAKPDQPRPVPLPMPAGPLQLF